MICRRMSGTGAAFVLSLREKREGRRTGLPSSGQVSPVLRQMLFCAEMPSANDAIGCCARIL